MLILKTSDGKFQKSVVALGFFDGVHLGHQKLIECARSISLKESLPTLVYTFDKHPLEYLKPEFQITYIQTNDEKADKFNSLGIDIAVFEKFSDVMNLSPREFVDEILVGRLNAHSVVCGFNFRFGKENSGDVDTLSSCLSQYGIKLYVIPPVCAEDEPISSSRIRNLLLSGEIEKANILLDEPFSISGEVVHGKHIGETMGFPTANIKLRKFSPELPKGVYFTKTHMDDKTYISVTNIGTRPTVRDGQQESVCETHIIDFHEDVYSKTIKVDFYKKHRDETKFATLKELAEMLCEDVQASRNYFQRKGSVN